MTYQTSGVCCKEIHVEVDADGIIKEVKFSSGCNGNLKGIAELAKGRRADEIIKTMSGIQCGERGTSCPDQLAAALKKAM
ncbi:MAG: TIGR03905 family TSCPD domain-containing protein [Defluviitaleaceae bacterium]|nr:TIGR03905 family TSCPD domain-containing protein [Defluviitaleaceae bacterium]